MNKDARSLRNQYGVKYQRALKLIQQHGLEGAIKLLEEEREKASPKGDSDVT